jgi:hypothetical protein
VVFNLVGVVPVSVADASPFTFVPEDSCKFPFAGDGALELDEFVIPEEFPETWTVSNAYEKKCRVA